MQAETESNVIFWDRLTSLTRESSNGESIKRGSHELGRNVVRIHRGAGKSFFLTVYSNGMQQVLCANIVQWASAVSQDGLSITLWLIDHSLGRNGYKRKFQLSFFDELSASRFFSSYSSAVPPEATKGPDYHHLRDSRGALRESGKNEAENAGGEGANGRGVAGQKNYKEGGEDAVLEDHHIYHHDYEEAQENKKVEEDKKESKEKTEECSDDDDDHLKSILEMESNWGESQNLFNPFYPQLE